MENNKVLAAFAAALCLFGCGGDDGGNGETAFTSSATVPTTAGETGMGAETGGMGEEETGADPSTTATTNPTTTMTTAPATTMTTDPGTTTDDTMGTMDGTDTMDSSGDPAYDECIEMAVDMCEMCACDNCLMQLMACEGDPGCIAIRDCARQNNCTGIECYGLLEPGPCRGVIDANGGPTGASTMLASTLSDCYTGACPGC